MKETVVTIGLGYIGLPTSALIAMSGIKVYGVDINQKIVDTINDGKIHIVEPSLDEAVASAVQNGFLKADIKPVVADVYLIVVPTPFKGNHEPDISFVEAATDSIILLLKAGDLIIIESTCPVGTTEKMMERIFARRPELAGEIFLAYCPERVLPGNVMFELVNNDRVIGGIDNRSTEKAIEFYKKFVKGELHPTNARTAEMCKLTENASRDVQIAFANELSMICEKAGINVLNLIRLANKHPRVNILQPGCGVGGHCIAVDPYFIVADYPNESRIIACARNINNYKTDWCVEKIIFEITEFRKKYAREAKLALMGLSFKPDIDDLRESPAVRIAEQFVGNNHQIETFIVEPNIVDHDYFRLSDIEYAIGAADIVVFLVAHKEFFNVVINANKKIIDFCGIYK